MKLPTPTDDLIIVTPITEHEAMHGSIHIPDAARPISANDQRTIVKTSDQWGRGRVDAIGPGARRKDNEGRPLQGRDPVDVAVGEVVVYKRAEASPMPEEYEGRVWVREVSIAGVVEEDCDEA